MSAARRSLVFGPASRSRNSVSSSLAAAMFLFRLASWRRVSKVLHTQTTVQPSARGDLLAAETVARPSGPIRLRVQEQAAASKTTKAGDPDNGSHTSDQLS